MTTFHLGDILSLIATRALSPTGLSAVKALTNHVTGRNNFVFEMPHAMQAAAAHLREQFPDLAALTVPRFAHHEDTADWLAAQVQRFGEQHEVTPIPTALALTTTSKES